MGGSSNNNSFIPKRGPARRQRKGASRQVYLFTVVSYVLFFTTLLASAGVFFYERYVNEQLTNEVASLNEEINRFREADLNQVREFNNRLEYTGARIEFATTLGTFFTALELATAETAQVTGASFTRNNDNSYEVLSTLSTDSFDSSILQREYFEQNGTIGRVAISNVELLTNAEDGESDGEVTFTAMLEVPLSAVPFTVVQPVLVNSQADVTSISETDILEDEPETQDDLEEDNNDSV